MVRYVVVGIILVAVVYGAGCAALRGNAAPPAATMNNLFLLAAHHDTQGLLQMEASVASSPDVALAVAYPIALYLADPERYAQRFVESFPTTYGELMLGLHRVEIAGVQPEPDYAIRKLGELARQGNVTAARKILLAYPHSDGELAEALFEELRRLLEVCPRAVLPAFNLLSSPERFSVLRGLSAHLSGNPSVKIVKSIRSLSGLSQEEAAVAEVLLRTLGE